MARPLSAEKSAQVVALLRAGRSRAQVMELVRCSRLSVKRAVEALPPAERPEVREGFEDVDPGRIADLMDREGMSQVQAARLLGTTVKRVARVIQAMPPELRPRENKGGRPRTVDVEKALALHLQGLSFAEIGRDLGCTAAGVRFAILRAREAEAVHPPHPRSLILVSPGGGVPFAPGLECTHGLFPPGDARYCLACDRTGFDWHPRFKEARPLPPDKPKPAAPPRERWSEAAKAGAEVLAEASKSLSRKERRRLAFAEKEAARARTLLARLSGAEAPAEPRPAAGGGVSRMVASPVGAC